MNIRKQIRNFKSIVDEMKSQPSISRFGNEVCFYYVRPDTMKKLDYAIRILEVNNALEKEKARRQH